ncbi:MAG: hypothetical protein Q8K38_11955 [Burkholderiaceae bacterium]|nr:hypothetical protein [Burkholderiaceae bacterium]MDZ4145029.1 hypothetical protein [Burkholderiales bacterium]
MRGTPPHRNSLKPGSRRAMASMVLALAGWLAGCAALDGARPPVPSAASPAARECALWFAQLDATIDSAHVRDGGAHRMAGFPFVRTDRFLASFRDEALAGDAAFAAWGARLMALDAAARVAELGNLPAYEPTPEALARAAHCANLLWADMAARPEARQALAARAVVPDDYATWQRAAGLYALTRVPFFAGVQAWQAGLRDTFDRLDPRAPGVPGAGAWQRYAPAYPAMAPGPLTALAQAMPRDALGIPVPTREAAAALLQAYAPVLEVARAVSGGIAPFDRFGTLRWGAGDAPEVATQHPVAYQRIAYTRLGAQTLVQLVYSYWFPERPSVGAIDLLSGPLDAVVLRITLAPDGTPLLLDTIHACGCYHLFVPTPALAPRPAPEAHVEWAFVPTTLPALPPGQRLRVRVASGTHYVVGVAPHTEGAAEGQPGGDSADGVTLYALADDNALRALPTPQGGTRSAFWPSGIVPGTARGERVLFWPMGIESPGAMRQWGRQPTAFVGRRHFDDARLLDERFKLR